MTHKELLAKVKELHQNIESLSDGRELRDALYAVIKLHKPSRIDKDMTYCEGCSNSAFFPWKSCPTIQAIEKELQ